MCLKWINKPYNKLWKLKEKIKTYSDYFFTFYLYGIHIFSTIIILIPSNINLTCMSFRLHSMLIRENRNKTNLESLRDPIWGQY